MAIAKAWVRGPARASAQLRAPARKLRWLSEPGFVARSPISRRFKGGIHVSRPMHRLRSAGGSGLLLLALMAAPSEAAARTATCSTSGAAEADSGLVSPMGMTRAGGGEVLVVDRGLQALVRISRRAGTCEVVSSSARGGGHALDAPVGVAITGGSPYVVDPAVGAVLRIDPRTGARSVVSGLGRGSGDGFETVRTITALAGGGLAVVDINAGAVIKVDPQTGDRTVISSSVRGAGPRFSDPFGIAMGPPGQLLVADRGRQAIIAVDLTTGDRAILSGEWRGSGPSLGSPTRLLLSDGGDLLVVDPARREVLSIDPASGDRTVVSGGGRGGGEGFVLPVAVTEQGGEVFALDLGKRALFAIDRGSGDRSVVIESAAPDPTFLLRPMGIDAHESGEIVVVDPRLAAAIATGPRTGAARVVSDAANGGGVFLITPEAVAVAPDGDLVVGDATNVAVLKIDYETGDRLIISGPTRGNGENLQDPIAIAAFPSTWIVADPGRRSLISVDPDSGDRAVVSGAERGSGNGFNAPIGVTTGRDGYYYVADPGNPENPMVVRVDPATGDRSRVPAYALGVQRSPLDPIGIRSDSAGNLLVTDAAAQALRSLRPGSSTLRTISGPGRGRGPIWSGPWGVVEGLGGDIFVSDRRRGAIFRVDRACGDRTQMPPGRSIVEGCAVARKIQRRTRGRLAIKVRVKAGEDLRAVATGSLRVRRVSYNLRPAVKEVDASQKRNLSLWPRKRQDRRRIATALREGRTAIARLEVALSDDAGNSEAVELAAKLKR